ncbi:MAG: nickel pincer cofactor biosynthesis protein LarC [Desulfurococcaceae archaeon]
MTKILVIDCSTAGISGDMFLGALIDLGANKNTILSLREPILKYFKKVKEINIEVSDVRRGEFRAKRVNVEVEQENHVHGKELIEVTKTILNSLNISQKARTIALNSLRALIEAEAYVHGETIDEVHLHETGSADTIVDIVGSVMALEELNLIDAYVYSTPVALGNGRIKISHGLISGPALVTLELLNKRKALVEGGPLEYELTTPTGAALLVSLVHEFVPYYPQMFIEKIGYGAGKYDFNEVPNILRTVLGEASEDLKQEKIVILETDVDDVSGEVIGYLIDRLLAEGAKDVSVIPTYRKKNRAGYLVRVISPPEDFQKFIRIIMSETGSLGVRHYHYVRHIAPKREMRKIKIKLNNKEYEVSIKVSLDSYGNVISMKPEYESIKNIALETGIPLRKVSEIVLDELKRASR